LIFGENAPRLPSGEALGLPSELAFFYDLMKPEPTDLPTPPGLGTMVSLPLKANLRHGLKWLIEQEVRRGDRGPVSVARDMLTRSAKEGAKAGGSRRYHSVERGPISTRHVVEDLLTPQGVLRYPIQVMTELRRLFNQASEPFVGSVNRFRGSTRAGSVEHFGQVEQDLAKTARTLRESSLPREESERQIQALLEKVRGLPSPFAPPTMGPAELERLLSPPTGTEKFLAPIEKITLGGGAYPR